MSDPTREAHGPQTDAGRFFEKQWLKLTTWLPQNAAFTDHDRAELRRGIRAIEEAAALSTTPAPDLDYEQMRKDRGWPTPNHMRRTADALDTLTAARYGDVLRWFADLADASLADRNP